MLRSSSTKRGRRRRSRCGSAGFRRRNPRRDSGACVGPRLNGCAGLRRLWMSRDDLVTRYRVLDGRKCPVMTIWHLVFRVDSLTYTIAKALSHGGHDVCIWLVEPKQDYGLSEG